MSSDDETLGNFLRHRRTNVSPQDVGLVAKSQRKVRGLTRDEVAQRAAISVDYYTRLEQGRRTSASEDVLAALAHALNLTDAESQYLRFLAGNPNIGTSTSQRTVRPSIKAIVDSLSSHCGYVLNGELDVLYWNDQAADLMADFASYCEDDRNLVWIVFTDATLRETRLDWKGIANVTAGMMRTAMSRHPSSVRLKTLHARLMDKSPDFAEIWAQWPVAIRGLTIKEISHPTRGSITLSTETMMFPDDDVMLVIGVVS